MTSGHTMLIVPRTLKRLLIFLLLFPAIATVARTRIPAVIATTPFAYAALALGAAWAGTMDILVFGLVGAIPAALCSWLSNRRA
jgi:hypothetical protein